MTDRIIFCYKCQEKLSIDSSDLYQFINVHFDHPLIFDIDSEYFNRVFE